jgi:pimeloyl-ACP methyl ester carboxylesterase
MKYESVQLKDEIRKSLPGEFIQLKDGYVHYEISGAEEGEVVILVHGFSAPSFVWDHNYPFLVQNGCRVFRYDLYGRGYSDRPEIKYNMELYVRQLHELVQRLELTKKKFNLVGLSMGGGICVIFADQYPNLVRRISLIDPMGFSVGGLTNEIFYRMVKVPGLSSLLMKLLGHDFFVNSQKDDFVQDEGLEEYLEEYRKQMFYKGFLRAIWSTIQNIPFTNLAETYERVGKRLPMQLFWGEKDRTIPFQASEKVLAAVPSIKFFPIKNAGHQPQYTNSSEVNPLLLEFIISEL